MPKKLTSLADLAKMQFENLAPDPSVQNNLLIGNPNATDEEVIEARIY